MSPTDHGSVHDGDRARGHAADAGPTDEVSGIERTLPGSLDEGPGASEPEAAARPVAGFEHRRMIASARTRLFGSGPQLCIGRYRVDARLGAGGMGEVYLAHDPELERQVAVKRVLPERSDDRAQERLRREARALARLSHPNVVQVYEIGAHLGRTYLAMEYVAGRTLKAWLEDPDGGPRRWREILERFIPAGRGLAAAHEAGVVHRDFKPENVLLGDDEGVRVADFGLAVAPTGQGASPSAGPSSALAGLPTRHSVSQAVVGTIRYMPLEQLRGQQVDARSDQFAFCVALYEALWGHEPYALGTVMRRVASLEAGELEVPRLGRVPAAIWRVLRRGLAAAPEQRWPDMGALLDALECARRRRRVLAALGVGAALTVGALAAVLQPSPDSCSAVSNELAGVWDPQRHGELRDRFLDVDQGDESLTRVLGGLDRWARGWSAERVQLCRARRDHELAPDLARLRGACLDRQRRQVTGLVDELRDVGPVERGAVLSGAVEAVTRLPAAGACSELGVARLDPPPAALVDEVEAVRDQIDLAHELRLLGQLDRGHALARAAADAAASLGYGPLRAEAAAELAKAELDGGSLEQGLELLEQAIDLAEGERHDHLAAQLWTTAAVQTLIGLDDAEAGARRLRRAEVGWTRVEPDARFSAMLEFARGQLALLERRDDDAAAAFERAIARLDGDGPELPDYQSALAWTNERRRPDDASVLDEYGVALRSAERIWGPSHPNTAGHAYTLGVALRNHGEIDRATALLERAVEVWLGAYGRPHPDLANAELALTQLAMDRGDLDAAGEHARALAAVQDEVLSDDDPERGYPDMFLSAIAGIRGDRAAALEHGERALAVLEPGYGASDAMVLELRAELANHLLTLGRYDEAERGFEAIVESAALAPEAALTARLGLAELELRRARPAAAAAALEALAPASELGTYELPAALLRGLAALREGRLTPAQVEAIASARATTAFTAEQLDAWMIDLGLDDSERESLGLDR